MKMHSVLLIVGCVLGAALVMLAPGCKDHGQPHGPAKAVQFICPMHPTVISDRPGECPICGMDLVPADQVEKASDPGNVTGAVPGLVAVSLPPEARQKMGLALDTIGVRPLVRTLRTSARIVPDESRQVRVSSKVEGWVESLAIGYVGQTVKKGDPLLTIYSPDLVSAQQEYIIAVKAKAVAGGGDALLAAARRRLELWDISADQIAQLEKRGEPLKALTLYAPATGLVTEKALLVGQKIMPGESLLVVSDFSSVWAEADIYESDLPFVKVGVPMEISLPFWAGKGFKGTITFVAPTLDSVSRTVKARLEIPNPEFLLKPEMYAEALLSYSLGERLVVPEAAVMRTGEHSYVFRDGGDGHLYPVAVRLGVRVEGFYEVLSGVQAGDQVVTSANFLVDSESLMRAAREAASGK